MASDYITGFSAVVRQVSAFDQDWNYILKLNPYTVESYYPHCTDVETEVERRKVTCPRLRRFHSQE